MPRRTVVAFTWSIATLTLTLVVWGAVQRVAAGVTDPMPLVGRRLPSTSAGQAPPTSASPSIVQPPPTVAGPAPGSGGATPSTAGTNPGAPIATAAPRPTTVTTRGPAVALPPATTSPLSPTTTVAASTFVTRGGEGVVRVRCTGSSTIALVSATPGDGYRVQVGNSGPEEVEVHFSSSTHEAELQVACRQGQAEVND